MLIVSGSIKSFRVSVHADPLSKLDAMHIHAEGNYASGNAIQHFGDNNNYCRLPTLLQPLTREAGIAGYT